MREREMIEDAKQYPEVDHMKLDEDGNYYCRHVGAMTREELHRKSDIAGQLGWRDREIDRLRAENEALAKDAARYSFLRSQMKIGSVRTTLPLYKVPYVYLYEECTSESGIESAIDTAMEAK